MQPPRPTGSCTCPSSTTPFTAVLGISPQVELGKIELVGEEADADLKFARIQEPAMHGILAEPYPVEWLGLGDGAGSVEGVGPDDGGPAAVPFVTCPVGSGQEQDSCLFLVLEPESVLSHVGQEILQRRFNLVRHVHTDHVELDAA